MDDEALVAASVGTALEEAGATAMMTTSCEAAIKALARFQFSAAVLDRMHGDECRTLVQMLSSREIPYLIYSGRPAPEGTSTTHIKKPALPSQLVAGVIGLLTFEQNSTLH